MLHDFENLSWSTQVFFPFLRLVADYNFNSIENAKIFFDPIKVNPALELILQFISTFPNKQEKKDLCSGVCPKWMYKVAHSTKGAVLNFKQTCIIISFLTLTQILKSANKNRKFWKLEVNFHGLNLKLLLSFCNWFSPKNIEFLKF